MAFVCWLQIGLVSQEPLLFSGSVLDNIMYGKPDATVAEVSRGQASLLESSMLGCTVAVMSMR